MSEIVRKRLYLVTASGHKFEDYEFLLGRDADLRWVRTDLEDPVTLDLAILVRRKIQQAKLRIPYLDFIVEQTNLTIKAWSDLPGNVTGMFIDRIGPEGICQMLQSFTDRRAMAVTSLGYHSADGHVSVFLGEVNGTIAHEPRGDESFGWNKIFIPDNHQQTFAEMSPEQRNAISTRKKAVIQFYKDFLEEENADDLVSNRVRLRDLMKESFDTKELNTICFEMSIAHDEFGSSRTEKVQDLILYCERHNRMGDLLSICRTKRPTINDWPEIL